MSIKLSIKDLKALLKINKQLIKRKNEKGNDRLKQKMISIIINHHQIT